MVEVRFVVAQVVVVQVTTVLADIELMVFSSGIVIV